MRTLLVLSLLACVLTPAPARADDIRLNMEGTTASIARGNMVQRRVYGIPGAIGGTLRLKVKWHASSVIPAYSALRLELRHGDAVVLSARTCYSIHAPSTLGPRCDFVIGVSAAEAERAGEWILLVTNNGTHDVTGFNIEREPAEANPLVPAFRSVFTPNCPSTVNLELEGTALAVARGATQERRIFGIGAANGDVVLRAKWHTAMPLPASVPLKLSVVNGGQVVQSMQCYSVHVSMTPRCVMRFESGGRPAGDWTLRVTNSGAYDVVGVDLEKGADADPLMAPFTSTYLARCQ